jgi:hypothetical protein
MPFARSIGDFRKDEDGGVLVFWAVTLVLFLGLIGLIFDTGRLGTVQSELQSFADSVTLAAAAELDGREDAIDRARSAAMTLITDQQTFAEGGKTLDANESVTLTFYRPDIDGSFTRSESLVTTDPHSASFVQARIADHTVASGFGAAFAAMRGGAGAEMSASAFAVAGFSLEACNVAPVAMCLPSLDFDAASSIGQTLEMQAKVGLGPLLPGQIAAVDTLTNSLGGLNVCAGLIGGALEACLLAARKPETACAGQGGLELSASLSGTDMLEAINTRFGEFSGVASGLLGDPDFSEAPNVLTGLTNELGLCLPIDLLPGEDDIGLPVDDCLASGACGVQGDGQWSAGRAAYIEAHYDGDDPHPSASTRFEFYQAEIAAASTGGLPGGGVGGLLGGFVPQMCAPQENQDPKRRLMVVAGIDCHSAEVDASTSVPPVRQFFEVFTLGPAKDGKLSVEVSACLGKGCGTGNLDTDVRDVVRLVE